MVKVGIGDALGHGRVVGMDINAVAYQQDGKDTVWVQIGTDLTGSMSAAAAAATTMPTGPIDPNAPGLTIEQRMRLRRMQELNRH